MDYRIILTGGEFSPVTEELVGEVAIKSFESLNIDIAFAATNGIIDNNVTTAQFVEGAVQNAALCKNQMCCCRQFKKSAFLISTLFVT